MAYTTSIARRARAGIWRCAVVVVALTAFAACSGSTPLHGHQALTLEVVTASYPVAQVVDLIGEGKAHATDLVPPGSDPFAFRPTAAQDSQIQQAGLLILAGQSVQPASYAASGSAKQKLDLGTAASEPSYWLDPPAMRQAVPAIEAAMERADPGDAGAYRAGARALEVELDSTAIDYQSTLSTCPRRTIFAADDAFAGVARRYDLDYHTLGHTLRSTLGGTLGGTLGTSAPADPATIAAESASVRATGATAVFAETWVPAETVSSVAAAAGVKVRTLDTLLGPPPGGWPRQATYINLLESNLGRLNDALGCAGSSTGP